MKTKIDFNKFGITIIIGSLFMIPILLFLEGVMFLLETNFSLSGIVISIFLFILSISAFFNLNLHKILEEILKGSCQDSQ